jgi:hypothetical protein
MTAGQMDRDSWSAARTPTIRNVATIRGRTDRRTEDNSKWTKSFRGRAFVLMIRGIIQRLFMQVNISSCIAMTIILFGIRQWSIICKNMKFMFYSYLVIVLEILNIFLKIKNYFLKNTCSGQISITMTYFHYHHGKIDLKLQANKRHRFW